MFKKTVELLQRAFKDVTSSSTTTVNTDPAAQKYFHAYFARLIPQQRYINALGLLVYVTGLRVTGLYDSRNYEVRGLPNDSEGAQKTLIAVMTALENVSLGGDRIEQAWAIAVNRLIDCEVAQESAQRSHGKPIRRSLEETMEDSVMPWISLMKERRGSHRRAHGRHTHTTDPSQDPIKQLLNQASIDKMGRAKAQDLCDAIIDGDHMLTKETEYFLHVITPFHNTIQHQPTNPNQNYLSTPSARHSLANLLSTQLQTRVLHAATSTVHLLQTYMRLILRLRALDESGIVLRRLATPIQSFLRTRPDALTIVLSSLLEPPGAPAHSTSTFCAEIAACMRDAAADDFRGYHEAADLSDEKWMPEPVDADAGHQASRHLDAIAHLVAIAPREQFVQELQTVLASRLLHRASASFAHELRLLNLFKQRFEELQIQACEIMVRDVLASQVLDESLGEGEGVEEVEFHVMVLSKFYWPELASAEFKVPERVRAKAGEYEERFRAKKRRRKLEYLDGLGRASVRLELEDRVVEVECAPYQAAVVDLFGGGGSRRRVDQVAEALDMDVQLARQACAFWAEQKVLAAEPDADGRETYSVLERLPASAALPSTPKGVPTLTGTTNEPFAATPPVKKPEDALSENRELYSRVVEGMLTNQGAMPTVRIHGMMKMVLPGGFPFSVEDMRERLLLDLEKRGRIEMGREGVWRVKREGKEV